VRLNFAKTLLELAESNDRIFLVCADLGFSVLEPFAERYPDRYLNVGVAEQAMAGIAAGLAQTGYTVFIYSIANFPTLRCLEQIRNDICYHGSDVKVIAVGSGLAYGSQGYTHHAVEDVAVMGSLPGMEVFSPADPVEVVAVTRALAVSGRPGYMRISRSGEPVLSDRPIADIRSARVLADGADTVILATGAVADLAVQARARLGQSVGVVSLPCLKPFPGEEVLRLIGRARRVVTVEEHILRGGLYSELCRLLVQSGLRPHVEALGVSEISGDFIAGSREQLLAKDGLTVDHVCKAATG
jgi:transketolase